MAKNDRLGHAVLDFFMYKSDHQWHHLYLQKVRQAWDEEAWLRKYFAQKPNSPEKQALSATYKTELRITPLMMGDLPFPWGTVRPAEHFEERYPTLLALMFAYNAWTRKVYQLHWDLFE